MIHVAAQILKLTIPVSSKNLSGLVSFLYQFGKSASFLLDPSAFKPHELGGLWAFLPSCLTIRWVCQPVPTSPGGSPSAPGPSNGMPHTAGLAPLRATGAQHPPGNSGGDPHTSGRTPVLQGSHESASQGTVFGGVLPRGVCLRPAGCGCEPHGTAPGSLSAQRAKEHVGLTAARVWAKEWGLGGQGRGGRPGVEFPGRRCALRTAGPWEGARVGTEAGWGAVQPRLPERGVEPREQGLTCS